MKLVIFMPAYNEEESIGQVLSSIPKVKGFSEQEILVVDDGSKDRTAEIAKKKGAVVVKHVQNRGVGGAFQTGVLKALELGGDIMVTIDADGQFPSEKIPQLIKPIMDKEADFVTASRFSREVDMPKNISSVRLWGNRQVAKIISFLLGRKFSDVACGFRAYSKEALLNLNVFGQFTYTQEVFIDLSMKNVAIKEVPITGVKYFEGRNKKSRVFKGALDYARKALAIILRTIRDYQPLKFFGLLGLGLFCLGLLLDGFLFIHYVRTGSFSPYISVGFIGGFLNILGIILFIVGLLADMIGSVRGNQERILYYLKSLRYNDQKK
ncbi:glycosyltransferase family 2 protein [Candidatus Dojkabacteria bacterium]|nr:glycosyltransferase family 2 protein [Candidatus Dojkabacteria bacterium]